MKLSQLGEFGLIERVSKKVGISGSRVKTGIGDDAAVIKVSKEILTVFTADALIEKVHFDLKFTSFFELGSKALAVNISDIAAMGGAPKEALVTLGLTKTTSVEDIDELYRGLQKTAKKYGVDIVGGDTVFSPKALVLNIAMLGEVEEKNLLLRSGAAPGDAVLVTGDLGSSALGLEVLKHGAAKKFKSSRSAVQKHLVPVPRVREARVIAKTGLATSMMDISDGLVRSLAEIGKASGAGFLIQSKALPVKKCVKDIACRLNLSPLGLALTGGEDYELVVTCAKKNAARLAKIVKKKTGTTLSSIGEVKRRSCGVVLETPTGEKLPLKIVGFEHFKEM